MIKDKPGNDSVFFSLTKKLPFVKLYFKEQLRYESLLL